jgi:hypothetical protein
MIASAFAWLAGFFHVTKILRKEKPVISPAFLLLGNASAITRDDGDSRDSIALRWRCARGLRRKEGVFSLLTQPYGFAFARLGLG